MRLLAVYSRVAYGRLDSVLSSWNGGWEEAEGTRKLGLGRRRGRLCTGRANRRRVTRTLALTRAAFGLCRDGCGGRGERMVAGCFGALMVYR